MAAGQLWQWLGFALITVAAVPVLQWSWRARQRQVLDRQRSELEFEVLRERVGQIKDQRARQARAALAWNGFRKFRVFDRTEEAPGITSFRLAPHDLKPVAAFKPGQYLSFRLRVPDQARPVVRCYSLSDYDNRDNTYRVTIKRIVHEDDEPGVGSGYLHDRIDVGDILDIKAPTGRFIVDPGESGDVVLIGAGIGITPIYAMLRALVASGSQREIRLFFGARSPEQLIWREQIDALAASNEHIHVSYFVSGDESQARSSGASHGHISLDALRAILPSSNYQFYLCGPAAMMEELNGDLKSWGVPPKDIHFESFGPSTVRSLAPADDQDQTATTVTFQRSEKQVQWDPTATSLLDLAEANGIAIESGCRAGSCGTCVTAIKSGRVDYLMEPDEPPAAGSCLTCICRPAGSLVLDA